MKLREEQWFGRHEGQREQLPRQEERLVWERAAG